MTFIEIDLSGFQKAERPGLVKKKVIVHRKGRTFTRNQWVKSGEVQSAADRSSATTAGFKEVKENGFLPIEAFDPRSETPNEFVIDLAHSITGKQYKEMGIKTPRLLAVPWMEGVDEATYSIVNDWMISKANEQAVKTGVDITRQAVWAPSKKMYYGMGAADETFLQHVDEIMGGDLTIDEVNDLVWSSIEKHVKPSDLKMIDIGNPLQDLGSKPQGKEIKLPNSMMASEVSY